MGVHIEQVTRVQKAKVERYKVTRLYRAEKEWEGIHPVNVETDVYEDNVELPIGSWLVPLAQPLGNLVATLLEPESVCGFVNFCVIPAEEEKGLFVSRLIKIRIGYIKLNSVMTMKLKKTLQIILALCLGLWMISCQQEHIKLTSPNGKLSLEFTL